MKFVLARAIATLACVSALSACTKSADAPAQKPTVTAAQAISAAPLTQSSSINWIRTNAIADIDAAFATARSADKPVFLFWTAAWCPPCNHVKATIFTRDEFVAKSRAFVPVYIDGDTPSGQALGKRFNVSGYPTMVLLTPDGNEVTRLEGSVEPAKYMQLLDHGLAGGASARQLLASALAGKSLSAADWRLLAYYSWGTDDGQLVAEKDVAPTLLKLARSCPPEQREASSRLLLQALGAAATTKGEAKPNLDKADALASFNSVLARPELVREHYDQLAFAADDIVGLVTTPKSAQRTQLIETLNTAFDGLANDNTLGNAGRIWATTGKVAVARVENKEGNLPAPLLDEVRAQALRVDTEIVDPIERQSVIYSAGSMLARAGLLDESDALMTRELKRSHSPYYYMLVLASNAKKRKTPAGNLAAIDWARQGYEAAVGPATRLEWGGAYVRYLIDLAPDDAARIETSAAQVVGELRTEPGAFSGRSKRTLERLSGRLIAWNKNGRHDAALARLNAQVAPICVPAAADAGDRADCANLFKPARA
ncbi:MAG: thioredoxin family protein [Burkholderiaceae bacterium]|nr:thioredoxin family protein [Burkholderiaceae bacterium]